MKSLRSVVSVLAVSATAAVGAASCTSLDEPMDVEDVAEVGSAQDVAPTRTCPYSDGFVCADRLGGDSKTLYYCKENEVVQEISCPFACIHEDIGADDRCN
jgi:hypothetical protein